MNRIKQLRQEKGLSLQDLQDAFSEKYNLKVSRASFSNYERGEQQPKQEVWDKLASILEADPLYIMGLSNHRTKEEADLTNYYLEEINKLINSTYDAAPMAADIIVDISKIFNNLYDFPSNSEMEDLKKIVSSLEKLYNPERFLFSTKEKTKEDVQLILSNYQNILDILNKRMNDLTENI